MRSILRLVLCYVAVVCCAAPALAVLPTLSARQALGTANVTPVALAIDPSTGNVAVLSNVGNTPSTAIQLDVYDSTLVQYHYSIPSYSLSGALTTGGVALIYDSLGNLHSFLRGSSTGGSSLFDIEWSGTLGANTQAWASGGILGAGTYVNRDTIGGVYVMTCNYVNSGGLTDGGYDIWRIAPSNAWHVGKPVQPPTPPNEIVASGISVLPSGSDFLISVAYTDSYFPSWQNTYLYSYSNNGHGATLWGGGPSAGYWSGNIAVGFPFVSALADDGLSTVFLGGEMTPGHSIPPGWVVACNVLTGKPPKATTLGPAGSEAYWIGSMAYGGGAYPNGTLVAFGTATLASNTSYFNADYAGATLTLGGKFEPAIASVSANNFWQEPITPNGAYVSNYQLSGAAATKYYTNTISLTAASGSRLYALDTEATLPTLLLFTGA